MRLLISTEKYAKRADLPEDEVRRMFHAGLIEGKQESPKSKIYLLVDDSPPPKPDPKLMAMVEALCKQFNTKIDDIEAF